MRTFAPILFRSGLRRAVVVLNLLLAVAARAQDPNSIIFTKHNLSSSGPGTIRSATEAEVCIFCHTPHHALADGPLWNHKMSQQTYTPHLLVNATVGQPTGSSRLCLSCHDGTVALGMVHSRSGIIPVTGNTMPAGPNNLGTDLSADHPVSFTYDSALVTRDGNLQDPATLVQDVRLDRNQQVQCTSCHDPHNNQFGSFLVMDNSGAQLCLQCHKLGTWSGSPHAVSPAALPVALQKAVAAKPGAKPGAAAAAPAATVAQAGCATCHVPHTAADKHKLLRFATPEENCYSCHGGAGPAQNVAADFKKISAHPLTLNSLTHAAQEDIVNPGARHVTCADCHNPHASATTPGSASQLAGALAGVAGVTAGGAVVRAITHEYELCFRCHADSAARGAARVTRLAPETNKRLQFSAGNLSFHPVTALGRNASSPSLLTPWTVSSQMACSDCHSSGENDASGQPSRAAHGSVFTPILERQLVLTDYNPESAANYALCYKCHSRTVVTSEQASSWKYHKKHVVEERTACTTCHDSHGVAGNAHLINFNLEYVKQNGTTPIRFVDGTSGNRYCTLTCHGKTHGSSMKY